MDGSYSDSSTLRRRAPQLSHRAPSFTYVQEEDDESKFSKAIKKMDLYARVDEDLTVKTQSGATVSLIFWMLLLVLIAAELIVFLKKRDERVEIMRVDSTIGHKLEIRLNMTFHAINCLDLHIDAMDVAGDNQLDVEHSMLKQRLDYAGKHIGEVISEEVSLLEHRATLPEDYCGSCYGKDDRGKAAARMDSLNGAKLPCCNTCHEVIESYALRGWSTAEVRKNAEQCIRESHLSEPLQDYEGCNISGLMRVNKVAGNFHMAMGESMVKDGKHVHLFNVDESDSFNISHTIHSLSFGDTYPDMPQNPLDDTEQIVDEETGTGLMQYYINLVPTVYRDKSDSKIEKELITSQFTYTMKFRSIYGYDDYHIHEHHSQPNHHHAIGEFKGNASLKQKRPITQYLLPGVFFVYDLAPFMLDVEVSRQPFSHFLIRLCAVVGGVYAVTGMLDQLIYSIIGGMKGRGLLPS